MLGLKLYRLSPTEFVGEDEARALWMFPARKGGWNAKTPWVGNAADLVELARSQARGTRWPGTGSTSGPKVTPSGVRVGYVLPESTVELIDRLAGLPGVETKTAAIVQAVEMMAQAKLKK